MDASTYNIHRPYNSSGPNTLFFSLPCITQSPCTRLYAYVSTSSSCEDSSQTASIRYASLGASDLRDPKRSEAPFRLLLRHPIPASLRWYRSSLSFRSARSLRRVCVFAWCVLFHIRLSCLEWLLNLILNIGNADVIQTLPPRPSIPGNPRSRAVKTSSRAQSPLLSQEPGVVARWVNNVNVIYTHTNFYSHHTRIHVFKSRSRRP